MNVTDKIRRAFRTKYAFDVQATWLQACVSWLRDQFQLADLTNDYSLEKVYHQWLHTDLTLIADANCLPTDLDLNAKKVQLSGKYALQINSILCISEPYYTQVIAIHGDQNENEGVDADITETQQWKPPAPKRVLYLELTDGKTILRGLEYEAIKGLDRDTTLPGAKILVSGPVVFRRGMLLLTSKNTQILGGYVDSLMEKNTSMETTLASLSKTASKLDESRVRFDRLNIKVHLHALLDDESTKTEPTTRTHQAIPHQDEDEMDEFIRQAYADGVINDDSIIAPDLAHTNPPPASYTTTESFTSNRAPTPTDEPEQIIYISDDDTYDNDHLFQMNVLPPSRSASPTELLHQSISLISPRASTRPSVTKVSLHYTYLSIIRHTTFSSNVTHEDFLIKGCFSSLVTNPRILKNEFDLEAYVNDGSDCLRTRFASDLLAQRIGITVPELMAKRKECKNESDKQKFQVDFNERLKKFGHGMGRLNSQMTIRFFSDNQMPMVITIDDS